MFKDAKVGDRVWSIQYGWGGIVGTMPLSGFPIGVEFSGDQEESYTYEGKSFIGQVNPTLFWDEIKFDIPERPKRLKRKVVKEIERWIYVYDKYCSDTYATKEALKSGWSSKADTPCVKLTGTYEVEE